MSAQTTSGRAGDAERAEHGEGEEIDDDHRPEHRPDRGGAALLDHEQADEDDDRDRHDEGLKARLDHDQPLDRGEDGDGRSDHRIAVEERAGEDSEQDDGGAPARRLGLARDEGEQGEAAALPLVVGAHQDGDVFERHHDHHRPEDQAEHSEDVEPVDRQRMVAGEGLAEGVERRGADVAEDDPDRSDVSLSRPP